MPIWNDISYNMRGLVRFSGRQGVGRFWRYAGVVFALYMVGIFAVMVPLFVSVFGQIQTFAAQHPDQVTVVSSPGSYQMTVHGTHSELMPDMMPFFIGNAGGVAFTVLALSAAVARRLHDCGRSGWFGALPLPFLVAGLVGFTKLIPSMGGQPDMRLFGALFANNFVYLGCLGFLIFLLTRPSDPAGNRFGPPLAG